MNILITAPSLEPSQNISGISTIVNLMIKYNVEQKYFHYLSGRPDQIKNKLIRIFAMFKQFFFFPSFLKRNKIDIVHQNLPFDPKGVTREYLISLWCRIFKIPIVLHIHGGQFILHGTQRRFYNKLIRSLLNNAKQVIVLSEVEQKVLEGQFDFSNSQVLANSIDIEEFNNSHVNKFKDTPFLLYLGRIEKNKGILELVEVLKLLKQDFTFRFILCGTGPLVQYCKTECEKSLGNNFTYKGVISGEDKINTIKSSNLFILPSYFEGLPMALLETMACGVVPVVTKVGSMKHIIKHGINGYLVDQQDIMGLYNILKILLSSPELFPEISQNASDTITEQYNIINYIQKLNQIYSSSIDL